MGITYHKLAAIIGAGPAGLFAARELAINHIPVVLLNRDIKPGGLAEYGIYPDKHKMKDGLRAQFHQILALENIHYYGNLQVGQNTDLQLSDLFDLGFQAVLVSVGAQGTKWLGLPGEQLAGVYHAKDLVYHYNRLPPFSQKEFHFGKSVAVIGVGNVMMDITRYLTSLPGVDEVIAVARRGPGEVKFDRKELESVASSLDWKDLDGEVERVTHVMLGLGETPQDFRNFILQTLEKASPHKTIAHFRLRFLMSPTRILGDEQGRVCGLEVEENTLVMADGDVKAVGLGRHRVLPVDTVIFAIGDRVDDQLGLPLYRSEYAKNPAPKYPVEGISYEAYDQAASKSMAGLFVAGWSRQASRGLVGVARRDGVNGAKAMMQYLAELPEIKVDEALRQLRARLRQIKRPLVTKECLELLERAEHQRASELGVADFKFASNEAMLAAMQIVEAGLPAGRGAD